MRSTSQPGQTLAVTGAAGAVGGYAMQLAKAEGLRVIADASPEDEQLVKELGADMVVARGDQFADRVRDAIPKGSTGWSTPPCSTSWWSRPSATAAGSRRCAASRATRNAASPFIPVFVRNYAREQAKLDRLRQQVEDGQVTLRVARAIPADEAAEAHRLLEAGGVRGRLVLEF